MATPITPSGRLEAGSVAKINSEGKEVEVTVAARYDAFDIADEAIQAGLADGSITRADNTLVKVGDEYVVYTKLEARTGAACAALIPGHAVDLVLNDKGEPKSGEPSVTSAFNYGNDLNAKRYVRQLHEKKVKGPEKLENGTIKNLVALGMSQSDAEAFVKGIAKA